MKEKYFELYGYHIGSVVGVTCYDGLMDVLKEDDVDSMMVGEITKEQFESFGENTWTIPKAAQRFTVKIV